MQTSAAKMRGDEAGGACDKRREDDEIARQPFFENSSCLGGKKLGVEGGGVVRFDCRCTWARKLAFSTSSTSTTTRPRYNKCEYNSSSSAPRIRWRGGGGANDFEFTF